jgi:dTDP-4-amino-4,6-dideoxygalactose transaminase
MSSTHTPVRTKPWNYGLLSTAEIGDLEREYVLRVLEKRRLFRYGEGIEDSEAEQLEQLYRERLGVRHCLAVNGGTSALIAALVGAGVGPGDEVIVPGYTYIATAAAVLIARAVPVIVEVDDTLTMDPRAFEAAITPQTKAVMPVHMIGVPCQMDEILAIARKHGLLVVEDVAQANGGSYNGTPLGSMGEVAGFSFQQYKLVTAGEGGLVATTHEEIYARAATYHDAALAFWATKPNMPYEMFPGENYRMSELNAAFVLAQSQRLDSLLERLRHVKRSIVAGIADVDQIRLQRIPDPAGDVSYRLVFYLETPGEAARFSELLLAEGIPNGTIHNSGFPDRHIYCNWDYVLNKRGISPNDNPWRNEHYRGDVQYSRDMCPNTLNWLGRAIAIELHQHMADEDCTDVVDAVHKVSAML